MKKTAIVILILALLVCAVGLTACDSVSGIEITVYTNGVAETYKAALNKTVEITPGTKPGYYLKGYYSQDTGGEKYFDVNGESVSVWNKSFPTVFYAQWESIEGYKSEKHRWEKDYSITPYLGSATSNPGTKFSWKLNGEAKNLIMGNLDASLIVAVSGKMQTPVDMTLRLQDKDSSSAEVYASRVISANSSYLDFEFRLSCTADIFKDDYTLYINFLGGFTWGKDAGLKNLSVSFEVR